MKLVSKAAAEYIKSRRDHPVETRESAKKRLLFWKSTMKDSGWRQVIDDRVRLFAAKLKVDYLSEAKSNPDEPSKIWLPGWIFDLFAGDTTCAFHLLPNAIQRFSRDEQYLIVVETLLRGNPLNEGRRERFEYWLELKNSEEAP